ncbi:diacylglycerol kinase theta-like isoform X3 [Anneissia japonica]|nr:diacylglycerol kinase theta-like isoform X3 [Anneissia japonica]XP_033117400.1 diacylglycerol kinase theta-like isoform X3 [Anneissia japonica]
MDNVAASVSFGRQVDISADTESVDTYHHHSFGKKSFHRPTFCHHCTEMLWGITKQGQTCEVCNFVSHERCLYNIVTPCSSVASDRIKDPVPHTWSDPVQARKKFCNVCRRRLDDSVVLRCEVCEYYAHLGCLDFVVSDCRKCASYVRNKDASNEQFKHHWREGNLPHNGKCALCKKTCGTTECLSSMKCNWCWTMAHAGCYMQLPQTCTFGALAEILMPQSCLSMPVTNAFVKGDLASKGKKPKVSTFFVPTPPTSKPNKTPRSRPVSDAHASRQARRRYLKANMMDNSSENRAKDDSETGKEPHAITMVDFNYAHGLLRQESDVSMIEAGLFCACPDKPCPDKADGQLVKIYDGYLSLQKRNCKTISVPKDASIQQMIEAALRAYLIKDNAVYYYLSAVTETDGEITEKRLSDPDNLATLTKVSMGKAPSLFLRYEDKDTRRGTIKVFSSELNTSVPRPISINSHISVEEVIEMALHKFRIEDADPNDYSLWEVVLDKGVQERVMERYECPWPQLIKARRNSLKQMKQTRYYLRKNEQPTQERARMYVGNLPINLSEFKYKQIIQKMLDEESMFTSIDMVYAQYGSACVSFIDHEAAVKAYYILKDTTYEDKLLTVLFLPEIHLEMLPEDHCPLLVFVNTRSGGCQGIEVQDALRKMLNPHQVFDLDQGGPLPGLHVFSQLKEYKALICGGDGTVGWVLSCLDDIGQESVCSSPPIAVLPLGTGNDLSRVLKWGGGYQQGDDLYQMLQTVIEAEEVKLDRWTVVFEPEGKHTEIDNKSNSSNSSSGDDMPNLFVMNNYFGIGIDADLCLGFHNAREEKPEKFNNRVYNKIVYVRQGMQKLGRKTNCRELNKELKIEVDNKLLKLPTLEGILIMNISSWGSGADPWGSSDAQDEFQRSSHDDGMLEIIGLTGVMHLGQIQGSLRNGIRLAQASHIRIWMNSDMPVQVDGEPWMQLSGQVVVSRSALQATMLKKRKHRIARRNTEPAISGDTAAQRDQAKLVAVNSEEIAQI